MTDLLVTLGAIPETLTPAADRARRLVMGACETLAERYREPAVVVSKGAINLQWTRGERVLVVGVLPDRPLYRCQCVWGMGETETMETYFDALDLVKWVSEG